MTCHCKYPKKVRIGDDARGNRLVYCAQHGFSLVKVPMYAQPIGLYLRYPNEPKGKVRP